MYNLWFNLSIALDTASGEMNSIMALPLDLPFTFSSINFKDFIFPKAENKSSNSWSVVHYKTKVSFSTEKIIMWNMKKTYPREISDVY